MDIYRDIFGYVIRVNNDEAPKLKTACKTPEYHSPLLTQIANDIARLEKEPFETEPEPFPDEKTVILLEQQHGLAVEVESVPGRYIRYTFDDGTCFYVQPDGTYTERLEPVPDSENTDDDPLRVLLVNADEVIVPDSEDSAHVELPDKRPRKRTRQGE